MKMSKKVENKRIIRFLIILFHFMEQDALLFWYSFGVRR